MSSKQIGVITVRGLAYHPTRRLAQAAEEAGSRIIPMHPYTLWPAFRGGRPILIGLGAASPPDAVLPRQGAEIKDACLPLIGHLEQMGVPVVNSRQAIERARHKFFTLQTVAAAGLPVAETVFATAEEGVKEALDNFGAQGAVIKPISGRQGSGICRMRIGDDLPPDLRTELSNGRGILVQQYIAPAGRQDLRLLVIGGQVVAAMALQPAEGEFRANFHLGGRARAIDPPPQIIDMAIQAALSLGLEIAGVDLMIDRDHQAFVNEVNYAPGFRALEEATGKNIAGAIIDYVCKIINRS